MKLTLEVADWAEIKPALEKAIRHMALTEVGRYRLAIRGRDKSAALARASALNDAADLLRDTEVSIYKAVQS